jgi:hypothetical protein
LFNAGSALTLCWKLTRCFTSCISVYFTENFREENSYWSKQDFWRNIFKLTNKLLVVSLFYKQVSNTLHSI